MYASWSTLLPILSFLSEHSVRAQSPQTQSNLNLTFPFTTIDSNECVSPSNYLSCYEEAVASTANCIQITAGNPTAQLGCGCTDGAAKINCFAEACWNKVCPLGTLLKPICVEEALGVWLRISKSHRRLFRHLQPRSSTYPILAAATERTR